jgi:hypothetical protein
MWGHFKQMNVITIRLTDNEYRDYVERPVNVQQKNEKKDNRSRIYKMGVPTW